MRIDESIRVDQTHDLSEDEEENAGDDEEEMEKLEEEVKEVAEKLKKYRSSLPEQLKSTLTSILASQRPTYSLPDSEPGTSGGLLHDTDTASERGVLAPGNDEKAPDEVELLRDKISSNISAMPNVLKRMNECISRIDKLVSSNGTIHPAFKRKKDLT